MKLVLVFGLFIQFSVIGFAKSVQKNENSTPTLIIMAQQGSDYRSPYITVGFRDSSFHYNIKNGITPKNKSVCYVGNIKEVCPLIRKAERQMNLEYRQGAHDNMDLLSCRIEDVETVQAVYILSDDYGDEIKVERQIIPCAL